MGLLKKAWGNVKRAAQSIGVRGALFASVSVFPILNIPVAQAATTPRAATPLMAEPTSTAPRPAAETESRVVRVQDTRGNAYEQFTRADGSAIRIPVNERWRDVFEVKMVGGRQIMARVTQPQTAAAMRAEYNQFIAQNLVVPVAPPAPAVLAPAPLVSPDLQPTVQPAPAPLAATQPETQAEPTEYTDSSGIRFFEVRVDGQRMIISQPNEGRLTAVMRLVQSKPSGPVTRQFVNNMQQVEAAARAAGQDPKRYIDATQARMRAEASARLAATAPATPAAMPRQTAPLQTERLVMKSGTYYERVTTGARVEVFRVDATTGRNIPLTNRADIAEVLANAVPVPDTQPVPAASAVSAAINLGQVQQQITERIITPPVAAVTTETAAPDVPAWVNRPDPLQPYAQPPSADEVNSVVNTIYTASSNWQRLSNDPKAQNQLSLQALMRAERETGLVFCKVREADGTWYTNLIPCPQDRLINRILDRSRGLMMPGVHHFFNSFAYNMSPSKDDLSKDRQNALRAAHHATLSAAQRGEVVTVEEQIQINRATLRQSSIALLERLRPASVSHAQGQAVVPVRAVAHPTTNQTPRTFGI